MRLVVVLFSIMFVAARSFNSLSRRPNGGLLRHSLALLSSSTHNAPSTDFKLSTPREVSFSASKTLDFEGDLLVIPFFKGDKGDKKPNLPLSNGDNYSSEIVNELIEDQSFVGESGSHKLVRLFNHNGPKVKYIALVGVGSFSGKMPDLPSHLARGLIKAAKAANAKTAGLVLPAGITNAAISKVILSVHDSLYVDKRFKKGPPADGPAPPNDLAKVSFVGATDSIVEDININQSLTRFIADGVDVAKDLVGAPPNSKTPLSIAQVARDIAAQHGMEIKVLGEAECKALNMGGYLGVQQGSKFPPQFVHITYKPTNPSGETKKVALIGKGLTFDSGGYNLKAGAGSMIELMKFDMGGCGAILGAAKAIGQLKPKNVEVHFISAICENMISAEAMRPGDILVASNGKTIEVLNTDAEGRLTLADALVYADRLGVDHIVDLATLTGACIVGLGEKIAALYSSSDDLRVALEGAAQRSGEKVWTLPLHADYKESIKGTLTDLKNISGAKGGGSITAALFLQDFVENAEWAHIDMAGPVWDTKANKPTGFGVKMLVDYVLNLQAKSGK